MVKRIRTPISLASRIITSLRWVWSTSAYVDGYDGEYYYGYFVKGYGLDSIAGSYVHGAEIDSIAVRRLRDRHNL